MNSSPPIRAEVAQQAFQSSKGSFNATLSLGVSTYAEDGRDKAELIAHSDQCLYAAKHGGRNRTVCYGDIAPGQAAAGKLKLAK